MVVEMNLQLVTLFLQEAHHFKVDHSASACQESQSCGGRTKLTARRSRSHRFPQNYNRLFSEGTGLSRKVYESVAVSNAVELFKLIFLSTSTAPQASTALAETLRRYSQHDLFAAFSFLREKKIMVILFTLLCSTNYCLLVDQQTVSHVSPISSNKNQKIGINNVICDNISNGICTLRSLLQESLWV